MDIKKLILITACSMSIVQAGENSWFSQWLPTVSKVHGLYELAIQKSAATFQQSLDFAKTNLPVVQSYIAAHPYSALLVGSAATTALVGLMVYLKYNSSEKVEEPQRGNVAQMPKIDESDVAVTTTTPVTSTAPAVTGTNKKLSVKELARKLERNKILQQGPTAYLKKDRAVATPPAQEKTTASGHIPQATNTELAAKLAQRKQRIEQTSGNTVAPKSDNTVATPSQNQDKQKLSNLPRFSKPTGPAGRNLPSNK